MNSNKMRKVLIFIFSTIMIISGSIFIYNTFFANEENELYEDALEEIIVEEHEKEEIEVEENVSIKMSPDVDLSSKRIEHSNNDIIGRLEIPDLFNILIVRGKDNSYYLNHSIKKSKDVRGSEFLDYRLNPESKQINIYGHNSRDEKIKVPFLKLESFLDKKFFDENPYIIFQHDNGKSIYEIISIKEITTDYEHMTLDTHGAEFVQHVDKLKSNSIYTRDVHYDENSNIIVLQTCSHHLDNAYYVITGVKIEYN